MSNRWLHNIVRFFKNNPEKCIDIRNEIKRRHNIKLEKKRQLSQRITKYKQTLSQ